jgi:hypothetical protein
MMPMRDREREIFETVDTSSKYILEDVPPLLSVNSNRHSTLIVFQGNSAARGREISVVGYWGSAEVGREDISPNTEKGGET